VIEMSQSKWLVAKTDRLDCELLMRAFLGCLRNEKRHCSMVAIPTVEEEDARRPNRERQNLVTEQTRIVNQMKAIFTRFGIRSFRPTVHKAEEKLKSVRTAEGPLLPENTRANFAANSRGCASCASRSARSSANACASLRQFLPHRRVHTQWFTSLPESLGSVCRISRFGAVISGY
jgi:transposase